MTHLLILLLLMIQSSEIGILPHHPLRLRPPPTVRIGSESEESGMGPDQIKLSIFDSTEFLLYLNLPFLALTSYVHTH